MTLATTVQLQLTHRDGSETHKNFDSMVQLMPFFEQNRHTAMAAKIVYSKANVAHHPSPFDPSEVWLDFTGEFMISNSELTDERVMKEAKLAGAQTMPKRASYEVQEERMNRGKGKSIPKPNAAQFEMQKAAARQAKSKPRCPMFGAYLIALGELVVKGFSVQDANEICGGGAEDHAVDLVVARMMKEGFDEVDVRANLDKFWGDCRGLSTPKFAPKPMTATPEQLTNFFEELAQAK